MHLAMISLPVLLLGVMLFLESTIAKGGKGGGGGDISFDSGGGSGGGGGDDDDDSDSSGGYTYVDTGPECEEGFCACQSINQRIGIFAPPGSYYNGTVQITHKLNSNSAWGYTATDPSHGQMCNNNDDFQKTYSYPALFAVSPNGNSSDTNPIYWSMRGLQPPNQPGNPDIDIFQQWISIRSSDFVVSDESSNGYAYSTTDETGFQNETHTYWDTTVTPSSGSSSPATWNANSTYIKKARPVSWSMFPGQSWYDFEPPASNYITLSDVCHYRQEVYKDSDQPPTSYIPEDNLFPWTTIPTIYVDLGTTATIEGIGADSLTFQMTTTSSQPQVAFVTSGGRMCSEPMISTFTGSLNAMHWDGEFLYADLEEASVWNISATVSLRFEGSIIRENSTALLDNSTSSIPEWAEDYVRVKKPNYTSTYSTSSATADYISPASISGTFAIAATTLLWTLLSNWL